MPAQIIFAHGQVGSAWVWEPHPDVWLTMALLLGGYWAAVKFWGPRHVSPGEPPATRSQTRFWALGVFFLWIGSDWPMHELSEDWLLSAHMVQHLIFTLVAPPLLLLGTPDWLARRLLRPKWVMAVMRRLTRPLPALLLFNAVFVASHLPGYLDAVSQNALLHIADHGLLVGTALIMWWPVLSPMPELPRISMPAQLLYLFGQTIVPTVPASFLTFGETAFFRVYEQAPRLIPGFTAVRDQAMAGVVMKLGGGILLWATIAYLFFRWAAQDEKGTPDATTWQDLERELNKVDAR